MKTWIFMLLAGLAMVSNGYAAFPAVPDDVEPVRVTWYSTIFDMYLWAQDGQGYVRIVPVEEDHQICGPSFTLVQNEQQFSVGLEDQVGSSFCSHVFIPSSFSFYVYDGELFSFRQPFDVYYDSGHDVYHETIIPHGTTQLIPDGGVWKDGSGSIALYLQKYAAGSCIIVVGGACPTVFLDPDYSDGIDCGDLDGLGYHFSLNLSDSSMGTMIATLPSGNVSTRISVMFPEL